VSGGPDSAGVPWAGRTLAAQPFTGDDGRADPALAAALAGGGERALADALAGARVLVPVVALPGVRPGLAAGALTALVGAVRERLAASPVLAAGALTALVGAVRERLSASPVLAERVQGLELRVVAAAPEKELGIRRMTLPLSVSCP
jgi:hypothetical protein